MNEVQLSVKAGPCQAHVCVFDVQHETDSERIRWRTS